MEDATRGVRPRRCRQLVPAPRFPAAVHAVRGLPWGYWASPGLPTNITGNGCDVSRMTTTKTLLCTTLASLVGCGGDLALPAPSGQGVALDQDRIRSVTDRVAGYMPKGVDLFTSEHNAGITWEHLLRQTSDWSGTLWGKPDWADRPPREQTPAQWEKRELHAPGTFYKYNDTRVNVLALSASPFLQRHVRRLPFRATA